MRKLILLFFVASSVLVFAQTTRTVSSFAALKVVGNIKAELIQSNTPKVEISVLKGDVADVITEVKSGELTVKMKNSSWGMKSPKATVTIYYTDLQEIYASSGSNISSKQSVNGRNISIQASSGSSILLDIKSDKIDVDASSGSSVNLSGTSGLGKFDASSGATIAASNLNTKNAEAGASSGASVNVWATETLKSDKSSGGSVKCKGEPKRF